MTDIALFILMCNAPVGALDVTYFHLWKFRLFERPESVKEEVTHIMRGFLAPTLAGVLLLGRPEGMWFWAVVGLFAFDSLNSFVDVIVEPGSRAPRIVPPAELAVHFAGITSMGAAWAAFMLTGWETRLNPTAIVARAGGFLPEWSINLGFVALVGAYALVLFETSLFTRAVLRRRRSTLAAAHP